MSGTVWCGAILLALATSALAGCSSQSAPPEEFTDRTPLTSCGQIVLGHGDTVPTTAVDCMTDAHDVGAELRVSSVTTEGDTIVSYFRVGPKIDGIDLFVDGTADSFGPRTWTYQHCRGDVTISEYGTCSAR